MRFTPTVFSYAGSFRGIQAWQTDLKVDGTVVYVNREKRWARVRFESNYGPQYECFKF